MSETIQLGDVIISVMRKDIKNVHLSVYPPDGHVRLAAPKGTRLDVVRAYAISRLGWIRSQQERLLAQAREPERQFVERESHALWGRRHLLRIRFEESKPCVIAGHRHITLCIRPGSSMEKRAEVIHEWHKTLLHQEVPSLIARWQPRLKVRVAGYFLQRMKTKWGSCNPEAGHIRINTELVKKPKDLLEYVVVHEMAHLLEPTHSQRFVRILDKHFPAWREAREDLNALPLSDDLWSE